MDKAVGGGEVRIKLTLQYDGTDFHGWQRQPEDVRTVQGVVEAALGHLASRPVEVHGASRTDAGVHAAGQVASFDWRGPVPVSSLQRALNGWLPDDVRVVAVASVPPDFHARFTATGKHYRYLIECGEWQDVFARRRAHHHRGRLDVEAMRRAAVRLIGTHDFTSFESASDQAPEDKVRSIHAVDVRVAGAGKVEIHVWGRSFLYKMVRGIAGTLLEIGRGRWTPDVMPEIIASEDRRRAGPNLPPQGLCLVRVLYDSRGD